MNGIEFALPGVNLFNLYQYMVIFFVSSLRISSFLISAPFFSLGGIPLQVRIIVSISLTAFLFPVIKVPEIPRTKSGKIVELAVRKVIHGETINNKEAIANPESLKFFENLSQLKS